MNDEHELLSRIREKRGDALKFQDLVFQELHDKEQKQRLLEARDLVRSLRAKGWR